MHQAIQEEDDHSRIAVTLCAPHEVQIVVLDIYKCHTIVVVHLQPFEQKSPRENHLGD